MRVARPYLFIFFAVLLHFVYLFYYSDLKDVPQAVGGFLDLSEHPFQDGDLLRLEGEWEFYPGELLEPAEIQTAQRSQANFIKVPGLWNGYPVGSETLPGHGYATYRLKVRFAPGESVKSIYIGNQNTSYRLWVDQSLLTTSGRVGTTANESEPEARPQILSFPVADDPTEFTVQIANFAHRNGGFSSTILIGNQDVVMGEINRRTASDLFLFGGLFIMFAYHVCVYALRRKDLSALYFAILCAAMSARVLLTGERFLNQLIPGFPWELGLKLEYLSILIVPLSFYMFSAVLYPAERSQRVVRFLQYYVGLHIAIILVTPGSIFSHIMLYMPLFFLASILSVAWMILRALRRKREGSLTITIGLIFLGLSMQADLFFYVRSSQATYFMPIGFYIFIFFQSFILSVRFSRAFSATEMLVDQVAKLNAGLEEKVQARTFELDRTLQTVQKLNEHQNGDYFLTSLLIDPFTRNRVSSDRFKIDFFLKQKKQFEFRGRRNEIGGDINIAANIVLQGRPHIFFINGDAMGKSSQGAGGVIVLGSACESLLARHASSSKSQPAKKWLRDAFRELHAVFIGFGGCMLVSAVIGIVDEENEKLYFINAEHPHSVLLREGRASFLETELTHRKLGVMTEDLKNTKIQTHKLIRGDTLIFGSDGRDDIIIGVSNGTQTINEDEHLFLNHVEQADGRLEDIAAVIQKTGQLMDDLSLLKLEYPE